MNKCILCKSSKQDDVKYGEFLRNKVFGVHTFCLYLSSNLRQNGDDDEGLLGFLPSDIKDEVRRISFLKCCYCNQKYANIGCCEARCRRAFHFICGLENKAENKFCKDFRSYCHKHVRRFAERPSATETCLICFDSLCAPGEKFNRVEMIMTPCCRNGWFHKFCLQRFAKTAGYFFKCPLCNDDKVFRDMLPARGIFIPNQDAAWELEPNAFADLLERPNKCAAQRCKNKKGRKAKSDSNPFVMCHTCGSIAIHKLCLSNVGRNFNCTDCSVALEDHDSGRESLNSYVNQNDDEYVDVCHVSDKEDLEIINRLIATNNEVMKNKRDSGTHNDMDVSDEETALTRDKYRQINRGEEEKSNADTDTDDVKPCTSKRSARLRLESETSDTLPEIKRSCTRTRFKSETDSSSTTDIITNRYKLNNRSDSDELAKSKTCDLETHKLVKRKSPNIFTDSNDDDDDDDPELKKLNTLNSESSDQEEPRKWNRKRNGLFILKVSDDETPSPKQKYSIGKNITENIQHKSTRKLSTDTNIGDIKPSTSRRSARLRLESESSDTLPEIKEIYIKTRCITEMEDISSAKRINRYQFNDRRNADASTKSKTCESQTHELVKRKSPNASTDSDNEDPDLKNVNTTELIIKPRSSESSDQEEIRKANRKRKILAILKDSEDETPSPKQKCSISKNKTENNQNKSLRKLSTDISTSTDDIKPCTSKRSARSRFDSESFDTQPGIKRSCTKPRYISDSESSSTSDIMYKYKFNHRRGSDELAKTKSCDSQTHKLVKRKSTNIFTDSDDDDDDPELKNLNTPKLIVKTRNSESSDQEEIRNRKRKGLFILKDSDDETPSPKQKYSIRQNIAENVQNKSLRVISLANESDQDSDTDPIEYLTAKRSRTHYAKQLEVENERSAIDCNKNKNFVDLEEKNSASKEQKKLDISCIALRTRRKTISNNKTTEKKQTQNENHLNVSCIALRTRRKTICGRTEFDKQIDKETFHQPYGNLYVSNENLELLPDDDGRPEILTDSHWENFIVDDDHKEKDCRFEISCIANRTRRRKNFKCQRLPIIDEISDCNSDTNKSSESLCNFRMLRNRRINSSSSDELDKMPSSLPKALSLPFEKFPPQHFTSPLKTNNRKTEFSNSRQIFGYHPSNPHHPHNINRNRI